MEENRGCILKKCLLHLQSKESTCLLRYFVEN